MLRKYRTKAEKNELRRKLKLIVDSRERKNDHIIAYLDRKKIPYEVRKLEVGDYSLMLGDLTLEDQVVVERKHGLEEVCVNIGKDRVRFENEMLFAKAFGIRVFLVIEGAGWGDIWRGTYRSVADIPPEAVFDALIGWMVFYPVTILFCEEQDTAGHILRLLYFSALEELDGKRRGPIPL